MINVAAIRMQQFGVQFYQASLDGQRHRQAGPLRSPELRRVRRSPVRGGQRRRRRRQSKVNWDLLERRIASSEKAYQRQIIRQEDRRAGAVLRAVPPGARPAVDSRRGDHLLRREAEVRAGRGGLAAWARSRCRSAKASCARSTASTGCSRCTPTSSTSAASTFTVPAIIFDRLPEDHVVQMFVTINAKHTRLNASHLVVALGPPALSRREPRRRARRRPRAQRARGFAALRRDQAARRRQRPRRAGAARAGAEEAVRRRRRSAPAARADEFREESKKFFVNYFKQVAQVFGAAWNGRKYSIKIGAGAARVHPRRARRRPAARSGACRPHRLPRHRPRHRAVGPPHRRPAVRDRRRLEAQRRPRSSRSPRNCASRCSIPKEQPSDAGRDRFGTTKRGIATMTMPLTVLATRLPSNSRLPAVNIQAARTPATSNRCTSRVAR